MHRDDFEGMARREHLHRALRQATHAAHVTVNRNALLGELLAPTLTRGAYGRALQALYAILGPVEARIGEYINLHGLPYDYAPCRRMADLAADLAALGLMRPAALWRGPQIASSAALVGCLYVMAGTSLGGAVIHRHVRQQLGVLPTTGGRYFAGRGEGPADLWENFWSVAGTLCPAGDEDQAASAASELFQAIASLLDACATPATAIPCPAEEAALD